MANLNVEFCGLKFKNPVFTAAGPGSANAYILIKASEGGAGALVTKTISVEPAEVPKPCIQKNETGLLNCETWSEIHYNKWLNDIYPRIKKTEIPLIASIGYTPEDVEKLAPLVEKAGADAIEFSIHYLGTDFDPVLEVIKSLKKSTGLQIIAKVSPHYDVSELSKKIESAGVNAIAAINSVGPCYSVNTKTGKKFLGSKDGFGWLSGPAIKPIGLRCVSEIARNTSIPIIGVGGISSGEDAIEYIMAGASAVQICSAALLKGPKIYGKVASEINDFLEKNEYGSIEEIRGKALEA